MGIDLQVNKSMTLKQLKIKISEKILKKVKCILLIHGGKELCDDTKDLKYYDIHKEATLHLVFRLTGGKKLEVK